MLTILFSMVSAGEVNFTAFPTQLMDRLLLPNMFTANMLASIIIFMICMTPFALFGRFMLGLIAGNMVIFFCCAMGWLDGWIVLFQVMLVAGLFSFGMLSKIAGK